MILWTDSQRQEHAAQFVIKKKHLFIEQLKTRHESADSGAQ
jgi:hypothetical protein